MSKHHSVVIAPSITEKNTVIREDNKYAFKVAVDANKIQIREAVEALFDVKVLSVNTLNVKGKKKRMGRFAGKRADWKKAVVKIAEGQTIPQFGEI